MNIATANDPYSYCDPPMPKAHPFPESGYDIVQVSALVRHGDRAPVNLMVYGEDKYTWECKNSETVILSDLDNSLQYSPQYKIVKNTLSYPLWHGSCSAGQLTDHGVEQHLSIGKALRNVYIDKFHLFPDVLSDLSQVYVRSTDLQRTRESAMSQITGLWDAAHRTSATLRIPMDIYPSTIDTASEAESAYCPHLTKLVSEMKSTEKWKKHLNKVSKTLAKMNEITGCSFDGVYKHSDILHPIICHNMSLPCRNGACVTKEDLQIVHDGANFEMTYKFASDEIAKLSVGVLLHEIRDRMVNTTSGKRPLYALYLAHDFTIAQMFQAFHLGIEIWPPYASHMIFELWQNTGGHMAIRLLYNGEVMKIHGCTLGSGTACSLEEFDKILSERLTMHSFNECLK